PPCPRPPQALPWAPARGSPRPFRGRTNSPRAAPRAEHAVHGLTARGNRRSRQPHRRPLEPPRAEILGGRAGRAPAPGPGRGAARRRRGHAEAAPIAAGRDAGREPARLRVALVRARTVGPGGKPVAGGPPRWYGRRLGRPGRAPTLAGHLSC